MPEFLTAPFVGTTAVSARDVLVRLVVAAILGFVVAWIYRRSTHDAEVGVSFPVTLMLLAVLIAMVTQVIGNNVARAFSLVGALSIVRFRTVVRDTRDTAYVIFAVVVGMAVGASVLWVALIGIVVLGAVSLLAPVRLSKSAKSVDAADHLLRVRVAVGRNPEDAAGPQLRAYCETLAVVSVATVKGGTALDFSYEIRLRDDRRPDEMIQTLSLVEGVQDVRIERLPLDRL
jgi:hypothetical protein